MDLLYALEFLFNKVIYQVIMTFFAVVRQYHRDPLQLRGLKARENVDETVNLEFLCLIPT